MGTVRNLTFPIPERWLTCPRKGEPIDGTQYIPQHDCHSHGALDAGFLFLPFKSPMDARYNEQIPPVYRWQLRQLQSYFKGQVQCIVDLTKVLIKYK